MQCPCMHVIMEWKKIINKIKILPYEKHSGYFVSQMKGFYINQNQCCLIVYGEQVCRFNYVYRLD